MKIQSLGILGLGSRSTIFYIKELNRLYHQKKGGYSTCPFKLWNVNFDGLNNLLPETSEKLETLVRKYLLELQELNVDAILIPNITLHETIDKLVDNQKIIHPVHLTAEMIKEQGVKEIVLFGSLYMMESDYLKTAFNENIRVILPSKEERLFIDTVRKHIYWEIETKELIKKYTDLIEKYTTNYGVVLACTELSVGWGGANNKVFDMSRIQIEKAVENLK